ncbi:GNAT family N-acetyltransferase [Devosia marina]|uniref:GNAT family N-acetyltransferase n=1 Tax=Devosia marina TaxID=2683198 RepID=A0A7X3K5F4_9HYPH|nr:GNAT family N-acetyltransferase [Devosia marina]MVT00565.1 GNAT family N-acetyltransferase [Devosia marina]
MSLDLFETERLVLSGWRMDQLDDLLALHGNPNVSRYLSLSGAPWTREQAETALRGWIELFETRQLGKLRLTRKSDGKFIGRAGYGIYPRTGEPEIGYALFEEYHGVGYATEAASGLRDWIFRETDAPHFIGFADTRNAPSLAVLKKIGMEETHVEVDHNGLTCQFHVYRRPHHV